MGHFTNILVASSPGELEPAMLETAIGFAEANHARLTLLDVVEPKPRIRRFTRKRCRTFDDATEPGQDVSERMRLLAGHADERTDHVVTVGQPSIEVTRHVLEHDIDLVIVGGGGVGSDGMPSLPSGVMQLLRKCPAPVWVMRPSCSEPFRVLALVDPDPNDPVRDGLNSHVLGLAASLTRGVPGELHVGHAMERAGGSPAPSSAVDSLLASHPVAECGAALHVVQGHAGEVLPKLADDLRADLIVMGTVARTGISGLIVGNTAETILQSVNCSVLAVKPEGFVTPVRQTMEMAA